MQTTTRRDFLKTAASVVADRGKSVVRPVVRMPETAFGANSHRPVEFTGITLLLTRCIACACIPLDSSTTLGSESRSNTNRNRKER